jgi:hypothetical protein
LSSWVSVGYIFTATSLPLKEPRYTFPKLTTSNQNKWERERIRATTKFSFQFNIITRKKRCQFRLSTQTTDRTPLMFGRNTTTNVTEWRW